MRSTGVFVPLVTPFKDGEIDLQSYGRLLDHIVAGKPDGLTLFGTTAESLLLSPEEIVMVADYVTARTGKTLPLYLAVAGASTKQVLAGMKAFEGYTFDGYLVGSPYYVRPSQKGLVEHFRQAAAATDKSVFVYNIPFRSAIDVENDTLLELADVKNIIGVKDVCGDLFQTFDLLERKPDDFIVHAGQDPHLFASLSHGSEGAVLASAHFATGQFVELCAKMRQGNLLAGRAIWHDLKPFVDALFREPSPIGIKYFLWRLGVIASPECRAPLTEIEASNAAVLDAFSERFSN